MTCPNRQWATSMHVLPFGSRDLNGWAVRQRRLGIVAGAERPEALPVDQRPRNVADAVLGAGV